MIESFLYERGWCGWKATHETSSDHYDRERHTYGINKHTPKNNREETTFYSCPVHERKTENNIMEIRKGREEKFNRSKRKERKKNDKK